MAKRIKLSRRNQKVLVGLLVALVSAVVAHFGPIGSTDTAKISPPGYYKVSKFIDGDTLQVDMSGVHESIRFIGVDTPETHDPRKAVQCFGQAAANFTIQLIGQQAIRLEADPLNTNRDRYNRLLRYVYLPDGTLVNAELIKQGYGFAYTSFPFSKSDEFRKLQTEARQQGKGLWSGCQPTKNKYGGYTSNDVQP